MYNDWSTACVMMVIIPPRLCKLGKNLSVLNLQFKTDKFSPEKHFLVYCLLKCLFSQPSSILLIIGYNYYCLLFVNYVKSPPSSEIQRVQPAG